MKKYLVPVIMLAFIPSVAFASWWNPTSWSIWDIFFNNQSNIPVTQSISIQATTTSSSTEPFSVLTINNETPSQTPVAKNPTPIVKTLVQVSAPINTTLCNGTYWNKCSNGENLICPATGDAYCEAPQTPQRVSIPIQPQESSPDISTAPNSKYNDEKAIYSSISAFMQKQTAVFAQIGIASKTSGQAASALTANNYSLAIIDAQSAASEFDSANQMNLNNNISSNIPSDIATPLSLYQLDCTTLINNGKLAVLVWQSVATNAQNGIIGPVNETALNQQTTYNQYIGKALTDMPIELTAIGQANTKYFGTDLSQLEADTTN